MNFDKIISEAKEVDIFAELTDEEKLKADLETEREMNRKLRYDILYAKDCVFRLIEQFCTPIMLDDSTLAISNYCESALEHAFTLLGIEEDVIELHKFCNMYAENSKKLWKMKFPDLNYAFLTSDELYKIFEEKYETNKRLLDITMGE